MPHSRSYTRCFEAQIISHRADVVWLLRSCNLTLLDYYLRGAVKDKCYADKSDTIDALKDNIREAFGEIQLHTLDYVLKNWTDRLGYCMASGGSKQTAINTASFRVQLLNCIYLIENFQ